MRQNMGAGFGKCLGQGKDKNGEQQHLGISHNIMFYLGIYPVDNCMIVLRDYNYFRSKIYDSI